MKRGYTVEEYREMLARIRATIPGAAVTSDFIVGFCGETEADFEQTVELVRESRFKNSFIFKYSPRPGTKGAELFADDVTEEVEAAAEQRAAGHPEPDQRGRQSAADRPRSGSAGRRAEQIEPKTGPRRQRRPSDDAVAAARPLQLTGRTHCDRIVVFDGNPRQIGQILPVTIYDADAFTLFGAVVTHHVGPEVYQLA